jgi:hypothetical protein
MAGSVLNSTAVLRLKFSAKLNICASISATSPSCKTLAVSFGELGKFNNLMQQMIKIIFVELWKNHVND